MEITINPPNPANKITLTPPSGGNPITIYAGIAGPTGPIGPVGPATTLSVGGTTTGAPGSSAIVSLSGSSPNQYLYTTIPSGLKGDTGSTGASPTLSVNSLVGSVAYGQQAKASLSGTATNPILNLTLQSGQTGATGATGSTGATGASPTLSVNSAVASVPSGTQGSASLSGTATNPVLNLTLPVGATGQTGATGSTGATPTLSVNSTVGTLASGNTGIASIGGTLPNNPKLYLTLPAGSDASVTSANITSALGYTPIGDAPDTLHQYARVQGAWQTISGGGGGNPFDQSLNTTDNVAFNSVSINGGAAQVNSDGSASFANGNLTIDIVGVITAQSFEPPGYGGGAGPGSKLDFYGNFQTGSGFATDSNSSWLVCGPGYAPIYFSVVASTFATPGIYGSSFAIAPFVGGDGFGNGGAVYTARNTLDDGYGNASFSQSINLAPIGQPASPVAGQIYFDSNDSHFYGYNGTSWVQLDN